MGRNKKRKSVMEREELNNTDIDVRKRIAHLKQTKATTKTLFRRKRLLCKN